MVCGKLKSHVFVFCPFSWSVTSLSFLAVAEISGCVFRSCFLYFFGLVPSALSGGVVALLRTRLLFVYFLFRLLSVSFIFSCGVFLACAFCLCQVVRVELPVFFSFDRGLL